MKIKGQNVWNTTQSVFCKKFMALHVCVKMKRSFNQWLTSTIGSLRKNSKLE